MCDLEKLFAAAVKNTTGNDLNMFSTAAQNNEIPVKCEDQFVAEIEISKSKVDFIKNDINNKNRKDEQQKYFQSDFSVIALVLESPHKQEFELKNQTWEYLGPAMDSTGNNIEKFLLGNFAKYMTINDIGKNGVFFRDSFQIQPGKYKLLLINAVQYQCSLGNLKGDVNKKKRDDIFKEFFNNKKVEKDFVQRLKNYKPTIIINCCTGTKDGKSDGLHKLVQEVIDEKFAATKKLVGYHPATPWFATGFKDA